MKCAIALLQAALALADSGPTLLQIADWGGDTDDDPTWPPQLLVADALAQAAKNMKADGILLLGDNFYNQGVSSVDSKRFEQTFEDVYKIADFGDLPFHVIAGNHDHYGNAQAQVDYTARAPHSRWKFPSLWYTLPYTWTTDSGESRSLDLIMIDTVNLAGLSDDECKGCPLPGPANLTASASQWTWIQDQVQSSTADYLWVAGHYPIYSAGDDGTTQWLVKHLLPLLKQNGAHYLSGHDHMAEHMISEGVHMFLNGMGAECCYGTDNMNTVPDGVIQYLISGQNAGGKHIGTKPPKSQGGFSSLEFGDEEVTITFHKEDGAKLYSASVPRRTQAYV